MRHLVTSLFVVCLLATVPVKSQEIDGEAAYNSPLLFLVPQAKDMTVPDWVKPGTRISFYGASATIPQGNYTITPDPNGPFEDPQTGERYRTDEPAGAGGEGFGQWDVVAVGKHGVALSVNLYTIIKPGMPPTLLHTPLGGMLAAGAGPADLWVHPSILQTAQQFHSPDFFILRGPYTVFEKRYSCLCIVNRKPRTYSSQAYDLQSGVLISSTSVVEGTLAKIRLEGDDAQRGNKGITLTKFIGIRQLNTPGINGRNPPWVANLRTMQFSGQTEYVNTIDPSVRMAFPSQMTVNFEKRGEDWCTFTLQAVQQIQGAPPSSSVLKGVCGPAGLFWIDPAALQNLQPGQVLDDDPITHIRTTVIGNNGQQVGIQAQGPGIGAQVFYDLNTGRLEGLVTQQPSSGFTTTMRLQGMQ
jgi:hypothetical protein